MSLRYSSKLLLYIRLSISTQSSKSQVRLRFGQREISTKPIVFANYKYMTSIVRGIRRIYQLLILLLGGKIDITYRYSPSANKVIWYGWVMI